MSNPKLKLQINVDLADFFARGEAAVVAALGTEGAIKINAGKDDALTISVPDTSFGTKLPEKLETVASVVLHAIRSLRDYMNGKPGWYPTNKFPLGCADFRFAYFVEREAKRSWYIQGSWSEKALARTPANLTPEKAVERSRDTSEPKVLVSSQPFPDLERLYLSVEKSGEVLRVHDAFATRVEFEASGSSSRCIEYPASGLPTLEWDHDMFSCKTPVTQALQTLSLRRVGKPADWLRSSSKEAIFVSWTGSRRATDLRASSVSGPNGPAPLPEGTAWPCCSHCGERTLFSQSLDFRDVPFGHLLPGTTAVIFFCGECHMAGEWDKCSEVVWLGQAQRVVLAGDGDASNLVGLDQYHGFDSLRRGEMASAILGELERLAELPDTPGLWMHASYGTKAGGVPHYLQHDLMFFDRNGVAMEYIGQIGTPDHIPAGGFGYIFFSATTGETYVEFQDT